MKCILSGGTIAPKRGKKKIGSWKMKKVLDTIVCGPPKLNAIQQNLSSQDLISLVKENLNSIYFESLGGNYENFKKA